MKTASFFLFNSDVNPILGSLEDGEDLSESLCGIDDLTYDLVLANKYASGCISLSVADMDKHTVKDRNIEKSGQASVAESIFRSVAEA